MSISPIKHLSSAICDAASKAATIAKQTEHLTADNAIVGMLSGIDRPLKDALAVYDAMIALHRGRP